MKIVKIISSFFRTKNITSAKSMISPPAIVYDPKNMTRKEFREWVNYLSRNKIDLTFVEPDKFVTEAERQKILNNRNKFRQLMDYLIKNKENRTFIC